VRKTAVLFVTNHEKYKYTYSKMKKKKKIKEKLYETFWLIIAMTWGILSISVVGWLIYISGAWKIIVSMGMFAVIIGGVY